MSRLLRQPIRPQSALGVATNFCWAAGVKALLQANADPNFLPADDPGRPSILMSAAGLCCQPGHVADSQLNSIVTDLLEHKADATYKSKIDAVSLLSCSRSF